MKKTQSKKKSVAFDLETSSKKQSPSKNIDPNYDYDHSEAHGDAYVERLRSLSLSQGVINSCLLYFWDA